MNGDGLSLALVALLALAVSGTLMLRHGVWLPLGFTVAVLLGEAVGFCWPRWHRAARHRKSMRRWYRGHVRRW